MKKEKIKDFGQKIGGAKKDMFLNKQLLRESLDNLNDAEIYKYLFKQSVATVDYIKLAVEKDYLIAAFAKRVYDRIPKRYRPSLGLTAQQYYDFVKDTVDILMNDVNSYRDIHYVKTFDHKNCSVVYDKLRLKWNIEWGNYGKSLKRLFDVCTISDHKIYARRLASRRCWLLENKDVQSSYLHIKDLSKEKGVDGMCSLFGGYEISPCGSILAFSDSPQEIEEMQENLRTDILKRIEKRKKDRRYQHRKKIFRESTILSAKRTGPDLRNGVDATGDDYLSDFEFRGGEFGNWLSEKEKQESLNKGYDSLEDLASVLNIKSDAISLDGELSIAFGSRGVKNSCAHYEPLRKVINLTKLNGAGSLAHEWAHALDYYLGKGAPLTEISYHDLKSSKEKDRVEEKMKRVVVAMRNKLNDKGEPTSKRSNYLSDSSFMDVCYYGCAHGYWASNVEMFARAFALYIKEKLPFENDYLCGHADSEGVPIPKDKEKETIFERIDELIQAVKEEGLLLEKETV